MRCRGQVVSALIMLMIATSESLLSARGVIVGTTGIRRFERPLLRGGGGGARLVALRLRGGGKDLSSEGDDDPAKDWEPVIAALPCSFGLW